MRFVKVQNLLVCLSLFLIVGCDSTPTRFFGDPTLKHPPDELWLNNSAEPEWLDPTKCSGTTGAELILNMFEGLVQVDPKTLLPIPGIATRWEVSQEGKQYVFHLRKSFWSDGTPLTAQDFVWSWKRALKKETANPYVTLFFFLKGGEALFRGALSSKAFQGVRALDDHTLEVNLEKPVPFFLDLLSLQTFMPIPRHLLERLKKHGISEELWTRPEHIVSNGAFVLKEWKFRRHLWFEKNPRYWDAKTVRLNRVKVLEVEHPNTSLNLYATGEMDWTGRNGSLPLEVIGQLHKYEDFFRYPFLAVYFYWINVKQKPLDNKWVRQALNLAIDREKIVRFVTRSNQIPTADFVPDGLVSYRGPNSPIFDVEKAQRLLKKAGYPKGEGFPEITLTYNTNEGNKTLAQALVQMWKQNLGVTVNLENQEWKVFLKNMRQKDFEIGRMGWFGDYPDPYTFLEIFLSNSPNNRSGWKNAEYDSLLKQANGILQREKRLQILRKAESILSQELPAISLYVYSRNFLKKPYVKGFWPNHLDRHPWKYIYIEPDKGKS